MQIEHVGTSFFSFFIRVFFGTEICSSVILIEFSSEGFTGTKGAVKPRSSLDVTDRRSVKSTDDESPDFKSIVKTPLEPKKKTKKATKKRRKCKKGYRRNKRTHRCRKKKTE